MVDHALAATADSLSLFYAGNLIACGFLVALSLNTSFGAKWAAQALFLAGLCWATGFIGVRFLAWILWWVGLALYGQGTQVRMSTILMACSPALVLSLALSRVPDYGRLMAALAILVGFLQLLYGVEAGHHLSTTRAGAVLVLAGTVILAATLSTVGAALGLYGLLHHP